MRNSPMTVHWQRFDLPDADVRLAQFCDADSARDWFARLDAEIPWERHRLRLFGREIDAPRLSCWIGDAEAVYRYSGRTFAPHAWTPALAALREYLLAQCGDDFEGLHNPIPGLAARAESEASSDLATTNQAHARMIRDEPSLARESAAQAPRFLYNSVLCNLYRDGRDAMGWHSDNEPELGAAPVIASFSFGGVRRFRLRHRTDPAARLELELPSGSLLRMGGATQRFYRHDLPRTARMVAPRINLTYRAIVRDR